MSGVHVPGLTPEDSPTAKPRKGSALITVPPPAGAPVDALRSWLQQNLRLPSPVERVERWGASSASPVVLKLEDGRKIRFAEASDLNNTARLVQTVVSALGASAPQLPLFSKPDAQAVYIVAIRACAIVEQDDEVAHTRDWQDSLERITRELHHGDYNQAADRFAGLSWLRNQPDFDHRAIGHAFMDERYRLPVLVWASGAKYLRVDDVVRYVRGVLDERLATQQVVARMLEAGWQHARAEAWRPGAGRARAGDDRVRISVFVVPALGSVQHAALSASDGPETGVSPRSPNTTHAHTPARTRKEASGSLGTPQETPMNTDPSQVGVTEELGDTAPSVAAWDCAYAKEAA